MIVAYGSTKPFTEEQEPEFYWIEFATSFPLAH
jgi:hypothetical protein